MSKFIGNVSAYAYAVSKGYTGTEEEFAELMADYAEVGQRAEDAAESASASATASAQSASQASASEQGCARAVSDATSAAAIARARADEASGYAQTASTKASEAVGCVETATQKATESAQSASQALGYKNDAESAKTASQTAQRLAEQAKTDAITAKTDAESARDEAQEIVDGINAKAEQIDTNTADITELESTKADLSELYKAFPTDTASGAIASFSDGADGIPLKNLVVDINPVQDLHGYDSPWPAGGGKNLFRTTASSKTQNGVTWTVNDDGSVTVSGTAEGYTDLAPFGSAKVDSSMGTVTIKIDGISLQSNIACGPIVLYDASNASIYMVTNGGATITTYTVDLSQYPTVDHIDVALKRNNTGAVTNGTVKVQIEKGSTATAWTPYENICPISGWTEVDVYDDPLHGGNIEWNQLVNSYRSGSTNGLTFVPDANDKSISISGTITTAFSYDTIAFTRSSPVKIKRDGRKYIIICNQATPYPIRVAGFIDCVSTGSYGGVFSDYISENQDFNNMLAFHAIAGDTFAVSNFTVQMFDLTTMFGAEIADYIYSLERANAGAGVAWFKKLFPEDYYEYNEGEKTTVSAVNDKPYTHVNIQLGQTVYGGHLDVVSGELVIDRAMVDLGTLNWISEESYTIGQFRVSQMEIAPLNPNYSPVQCSILKGVKPKGYAQFNNGEIGLSNTPTAPVLRAKAETFIGKPVEEIKAIMQGQQLCYELAEPIEIQLDSYTLNSLYGANNIWADSGDTEVEYRADTKLFIERLTALDSADMIADANITSGQYFMVGNSLFKATANIANGSAIVVGTNCIRKSLSEALNEINA